MRVTRFQKIITPRLPASNVDSNNVHPINDSFINPFLRDQL